MRYRAPRPIVTASELLVQLLRHFGLAARFVSGYLIQLTADVKSLDGPSGTEKDFTDLHAWCEVYLPGAGWIGLDPTHNQQAGDTYVKIAVGRDYSDVPPVTGHYKGTTERRMNVEVRIEAL